MTFLELMNWYWEFYTATPWRLIFLLSVIALGGCLIPIAIAVLDSLVRK